MKKTFSIISLMLMLAVTSCKSTPSSDKAKEDAASHAVAVSLPISDAGARAITGNVVPPKGTNAKGESLAQEFSQDYTTVVPMRKSDSKPRNIAADTTQPLSADGSTAIIPKATAFRMSGDYANNVAVTVDPQGNLTYFPAPSDITPDSAPLSLADGWWLNRQGIGINSVFTKYTFAEYAALPSVPTVAELKAAIIPGARVTELITLPYSINDASSNLPEINKIIHNL